MGRALLVLSVVAGIDGTEDELEDPEVGSEVDGWVGTGHLGRLVLVVGCAVDHASDDGVVVELAKELSGCRMLVKSSVGSMSFVRDSLTLLVVADLSELEGNGARAEVLCRVHGVTDGILKSTGVLSSGLTVGDANNEDRLARLAKLGQNNAVDDLLAQLGTEWRETLISPVCHDLTNLLLRADVLKHVGRGAVVVHEADLNAVVHISTCQSSAVFPL